MLDFRTYQKLARTTAIYPGRDEGNYVYPALGLAGESGEICEKIKKAIRDEGGRISEERKTLLARELGDVLWYVAALASELKLDLEEIAAANVAKLAGRQQSGRLQGSGDLR